MRQEHWSDGDGNPAGGNTYGVGFAIGWQNGPLGRDEERLQPNGAFVEDVIKACIGRIKYYQSTKFKCDYNARALEHLQDALAILERRTLDREARGVEGTYEE